MHYKLLGTLGHVPTSRSSSMRSTFVFAAGRFAGSSSSKSEAMPLFNVSGACDRQVHFLTRLDQSAPSAAERRKRSRHRREKMSQLSRSMEPEGPRTTRSTQGRDKEESLVLAALGLGFTTPYELSMARIEYRAWPLCKFSSSVSQNFPYRRRALRIFKCWIPYPALLQTAPSHTAHSCRLLQLPYVARNPRPSKSL